MKIYRTSDPNIIRFFCPFCNYKNPVFYFSKKLASQNKNCWFCHHCKKTGKKEEIFDKGIKINPPEGGEWRFVTNLNVSRDDIDRVLTEFESALNTALAN